MDYPINDIPGYEGRTIVLRSAGILSGVGLYLDGEPVKPSWGKYTLPRSDGTQVQVTLRSNFVDPVPQLVVDGQVYSAVKPLAWYELVWSGLPVFLVFVGGVLGALCGMIAAYSNSRIFRTRLHPALKYVVTGAVSATAVVAWLVLSLLISLALQG